MLCPGLSYLAGLPTTSLALQSTKTCKGKDNAPKGIHMVAQSLSIIERFCATTIQFVAKTLTYVDVIDACKVRPSL
jgi:hypothetical protein